MSDIVERLLEKREPLFTRPDSVGRVYECYQPDSLHHLAAAEIARLRADVGQLQLAIEEADDLLRGDSFSMGTEAWCSQYDEWANREEVHLALHGKVEQEPTP